MPSNALREALREVFRDPALLLIEIGWRWTFGALAILIFVCSVFLLFGSVSVDPRRLEALGALPGLQLVQVIADTVATLGKGLLRVGLIASLVLVALWIPLSAFGRYATLGRPALAPGASLRTCFLVSTARGLLTLGSLAAWMVAGLIAGLVGVSSAQGLLPNPGVILAIVLPSLLIIVTAWSVLNWYSSFAPLFPDSEQDLFLTNQRAFIRVRRDEVLEISIMIGLMRVVLIVMAFMLWFGVGSVVSNPRVLAADFAAIALLYSLAADFLYVVRLAAYAKLRLLGSSGAPIPNCH